MKKDKLILIVLLCVICIVQQSIVRKALPLNNRHTTLRLSSRFSEEFVNDVLSYVHSKNYLIKFKSEFKRILNFIVEIDEGISSLEEKDIWLLLRLIPKNFFQIMFFHDNILELFIRENKTENIRYYNKLSGFKTVKDNDIFRFLCVKNDFRQIDRFLDVLKKEDCYVQIDSRAETVHSLLCNAILSRNNYVLNLLLRTEKDCVNKEKRFFSFAIQIMELPSIISILQYNRSFLKNALKSEYKEKIHEKNNISIYNELIEQKVHSMHDNNQDNKFITFIYFILNVQLLIDFKENPDKILRYIDKLNSFESNNNLIEQEDTLTYQERKDFSLEKSKPHYDSYSFIYNYFKLEVIRLFCIKGKYKKGFELFLTLLSSESSEYLKLNEMNYKDKCKLIVSSYDIIRNEAMLLDEEGLNKIFEEIKKIVEEYKSIEYIKDNKKKMFVLKKIIEKIDPEMGLYKKIQKLIDLIEYEEIRVINKKLKDVSYLIFNLERFLEKQTVGNLRRKQVEDYLKKIRKKENEKYRNKLSEIKKITSDGKINKTLNIDENFTIVITEELQGKRDIRIERVVDLNTQSSRNNIDIIYELRQLEQKHQQLVYSNEKFLISLIKYCRKVLSVSRKKDSIQYITTLQLRQILVST